MDRCRVAPLTALVAALLAPAVCAGEAPDADRVAAWRTRVEADWLTPQAIDQVRGAPQKATRTGPAGVTAVQDAAGGVDGCKTGEWGFHTANEKDPWWHVDLGRVQPLARVVLYNRCQQGMAQRMKDFSLLLSADGAAWAEAYRHGGKVFYGATDKKPLVIPLDGKEARFVRIRLNGTSYFHLDEVEVYAPADAKKNVALGRPADQSSTSQWSARHGPAAVAVGTVEFPLAQVVERGRRLARDLRKKGVDVAPHLKTLDDVAAGAKDAAGDAAKALYLKARWAVRHLVFSNPLLDFDRLLFAKRAPGTFPHMSDQYYGWWSRGGGGIYILENLGADREPALRCLTDGMPEGSFLRPDLSCDGSRILFAYARYYPHVASVADKVAKDKLPEDAFYHVYEMNADGTNRRRLTRGRYDDFDARYLPDGEIVFLSTRRGQAVQCGKASAAATIQNDRLPDSYVRCGGGNSRPVAIYTLHVMDSGGGHLRAISAFENFEWTPSVAADGRILYARWDYVDRYNNAFMSLWSTNPDGTNPLAVYGNYTRSPHCIFEARTIPDSTKIIFTASAHHSNTGGSLVLLDPDVGVDGPEPLTRLTPEVCFPETEGWSNTYYLNPWPLSETYYLVAWSTCRLPPHTRVWDQRNPANALGLYVYDAFGNLELLYRDPEISSQCPIPLRPRTRPGAVASRTEWDGVQEGRFLLQNVYDGLGSVERGTIERLRIVAMPAKVQPQMNQPMLGVTREDPGKCVLGTVPVETDGSAYFRVPSGVAVFFQALDSSGRAVQTMRGLTYVQAGQALACIGCHERRDTAPATIRPLAMAREPSRLTPGPDGSWPLRFDRLVQPVLDRHCAGCHKPGGKEKAVAKLDLTSKKAYASLTNYGGKQGVREDIVAAYKQPTSVPGAGLTATSPILRILTQGKGHNDVKLSRDDLERLATWLDLYGQYLGSFSPEQEQHLIALRAEWTDLLEPR
ncbi:MAG TPA: discoidin domain-containing protein [Phycisphaerae bacterium]|nr:discoidin domain-containing protein [Phycisphaerae bacterium]